MIRHVRRNEIEINIYAIPQKIPDKFLCIFGAILHDDSVPWSISNYLPFFHIFLDFRPEVPVVVRDYGGFHRFFDVKQAPHQLKHELILITPCLMCVLDSKSICELIMQRSGLSFRPIKLLHGFGMFDQEMRGRWRLRAKHIRVR